MHVAARTKAGKKQKDQFGKQLLRHYAQKNQDDLRLETMNQYGQEPRGIENHAEQPQQQKQQQGQQQQEQYEQQQQWQMAQQKQEQQQKQQQQQQQRQQQRKPIEQELLGQNIYNAGSQAEQGKQRIRSLETQETGTQQTEQQVPEEVARGEQRKRRSNGSKNGEMEQYLI